MKLEIKLRDLIMIGHWLSYINIYFFYFNIVLIKNNITFFSKKIDCFLTIYREYIKLYTVAITRLVVSSMTCASVTVIHKNNGWIYIDIPLKLQPFNKDLLEWYSEDLQSRNIPVLHRIIPPTAGGGDLGHVWLTGPFGLSIIGTCAASSFVSIPHFYARGKQKKLNEFEDDLVNWMKLMQ